MSQKRASVCVSLCVRACMRACARACVMCVGGCVCGYAGVRACERACVCGACVRVSVRTRSHKKIQYRPGLQETLFYVGLQTEIIELSYCDCMSV